MEQFYCKTKIISGDAAQALRKCQIQTLLLVTDPFFADNGVAEKLAAESGIPRVEVFSQVIPDPTVALAAQGTARIRELEPDAVAALGGGSVIDTAKAIAYFYEKPVKIIAIPTTSGSGSEVTDFAVLTHENTKHPLVDGKVCPDVAILDSGLLQTMPKNLVADAGFDILTHAVEAFVAKGAGGITDALAKEAFCVAFAHLPASYGGNVQVRSRIHEAATMAGMAFTQAGLGLCHAMAHSLGGMYHVPHGRLNAILIPEVVRCNALVATEKYARLARSAGISGSANSVAVRNLRNGLMRLRRELGLPETLKQAGIAPRELRYRMGDIVKAVLADPCCETNPLPVEDFVVRRILEEVAGNG